MNDDRVFESKKAWFMLLLELGMPSIVIEKMLDISQSTVVNYCAKLNVKNPGILSEKRPIMMKMYADLKCMFVKLTFGNAEFKSKLKSVLADVLEEKRIIQTLESCLPIITSFTKIRYTDDVPEEYRRLLDRLFDGYYYTPPKMQNIWYNYLYAISTSEIVIDAKKFYWEKQQHFVYDIIAQHVDESREYLAPVLTKDVCSLVDDILEGFFGKIGYILRTYYGIGCNPQAFDKIAVDLDITKQRVSQLYSKGIVTFKRHLNKEIYPISNAWQERQEMKQKHQQKIDALTEEFKQSLINLDKKDIPEKEDEFIERYPEIFFKKINEFDFSVRVLNCLKGNIDYIWELLAHYERDLWMYRNFGGKSLNEVRKFLKDHNLRMGMYFSEAQKLYFQKMTENK